MGAPGIASPLAHHLAARHWRKKKSRQGSSLPLQLLLGALACCAAAGLAAGCFIEGVHGGGGHHARRLQQQQQQQPHARRLAHLEALDELSASDGLDQVLALDGGGAPRKTMLVPHPRDAAGVQRYLADALRSNGGGGMFEIPVWFVVVTDPARPAATNLTRAQVEANVALLNRAFNTGLPGSALVAGGEQAAAVVEESARAGRGIAVPPWALAAGSGSSASRGRGSSSVGISSSSGSGSGSSGGGVGGAKTSSSGGSGGSNKGKSKGRGAAAAGSQPPSAARLAGPSSAQGKQKQQQQGAAAAVATATTATAFAPPPQLWRFALKGVRHVTSAEPMCAGSVTDAALKAAWRPRLVAEGGAASDRTLVVYATDLSAPACRGTVGGYAALFGFSNTPADLLAWKQVQASHRDGVVLDFKYLYQNDAALSAFKATMAEEASAAVARAAARAVRGASTGAQLVHEVGHWMGLVHTFTGGCAAALVDSDQVDDTPDEAHPLQWEGVDMRDASGGCTVRDTCPASPGFDLFDNFMSYNNLACARRFTPGQQARMFYLFKSVRES